METINKAEFWSALYGTIKIVWTSDDPARHMIRMEYGSGSASEVDFGSRKEAEDYYCARVRYVLSRFFG